MTHESPSLVRQLLQELRPSIEQTSEVDGPEGLPLLDGDDLEILMHRQAHFGGSFEVMLDYYEIEGKGALLDSDRIAALAEFEQKIGEDLASLYLTEGDREQLAGIEAAYERLRSLCETQSKPTRARLIADLILSEEEEEEAAVKAVIQAGTQMVPELVRLLGASELSRSVAPGYGWAPVLAARCLGALGDERAIAPLFEAIGNSHEEIDHAAIAALVAVGKPAQAFLLKILSTKSISADNERAAAALSAFPPDQEIAQRSLELIEDETLWKHATLMAYLAVCCGGLGTQEQIDRLRQLISNPAFPSLAREELAYWVSHLHPPS